MSQLHKASGGANTLLQEKETYLFIKEAILKGEEIEFRARLTDFEFSDKKVTAVTCIEDKERACTSTKSLLSQTIYDSTNTFVDERNNVYNAGTISRNVIQAADSQAKKNNDIYLLRDCCFCLSG